MALREKLECIYVLNAYGGSPDSRRTQPKSTTAQGIEFQEDVLLAAPSGFHIQDVVVHLLFWLSA